MRASRRISILKRQGVKWNKWSCMRTTETKWDVTITTDYGWKDVASDRTFPGYTSYSQNASTGDLSNSGSYVTLQYGQSGNLYEVITVRLMACVHVVGTRYWSFIQSPIQFVTAYYTKVATDYGRVYADEGAYPDANIGYTYVTHFSSGGIDYKVMRSGTTYYCYNLA